MAPRRSRVELEELVARARSFKPIEIPKPVPASGWKDLGEGDAWGAPPRRQVTARSWVGGNCLKSSIASLLGASDIDRVPDPTLEYNACGDGDWLPAYNKRLEKIGVRLEPLAASCCPPDQTSLWIAGISVPGDDQGHAIVCRGYGIVHDSLGQFTGLLPMDQLLDGFVLRPTERVVRSFSPAGSGYAVVAA